MKILASGLILSTTLAATSAFAAILPQADIGVIVDESGSMGGEHAFIGPAMTSLEAELNALNIGTGSDFNQYGLVGFGSTNPAPIGISDAGRGNDTFMDVADFNTATGNLVLSGGTEDGYAGINYYLNNYALRTGSAAQNVILVTDEDRDNWDTSLSFASILQDLSDVNALLNVVVNATFAETATGARLLGIDAEGFGYLADGFGGYTQVAGYTITGGSGSTVADYVDLALATGGAAWDLNLLRAGGLTSDSFTAAFVDIKATEIQEQVPVPAPIALLGLGLVGLTAMRRRRARREA